MNGAPPQYVIRAVMIMGTWAMLVCLVGIDILSQRAHKSSKPAVLVVGYADSELDADDSSLTRCIHE
jgi:hypothetical protein